MIHMVMCQEYRNVLRAPRKILFPDSCLAPLYSGHNASASCLICKASYAQISPSWQMNNGVSAKQVLHPVSWCCSFRTKDLHWLLGTCCKYPNVKRGSNECVVSVVYGLLSNGLGDCEMWSVRLIVLDFYSFGIK